MPLKMDRKVLVSPREQPANTVYWKKAIKLVYTCVLVCMCDWLL